MARAILPDEQLAVDYRAVGGRQLHRSSGGAMNKTQVGSCLSSCRVARYLIAGTIFLLVLAFIAMLLFFDDRRQSIAMTGTPRHRQDRLESVNSTSNFNFGPSSKDASDVNRSQDATKGPMKRENATSENSRRFDSGSFAPRTNSKEKEEASILLDWTNFLKREPRVIEWSDHHAGSTIPDSPSVHQHPDRPSSTTSTSPSMIDGLQDLFLMENQLYVGVPDDKSRHPCVAVLSKPQAIDCGPSQSDFSPPKVTIFDVDFRTHYRRLARNLTVSSALYKLDKLDMDELNLLVRRCFVVVAVLQVSSLPRGKYFAQCT